MEEAELMSLAGYLSPEPTATHLNTVHKELDPYVGMVLSQEPVEVQRAVVAIKSINTNTMLTNRKALTHIIFHLT